MSNPFPPGPEGPQQPNQGWNQQPGQPQQPQQGGWGQQPGQPPQGQPPQGQPPQTWNQQPGQPQGGFPPPAGGFPPGTQPGFYGSPPPPPPRKSKLKKILIAVAVLIVLAIVSFVAKNALNKDDATSAKAGDCLGHIEGGIGKSKMPKIAKCDSPDAKWKIVKKVDGSSDTGKCKDLPESSGVFATFYWSGTKDGVVCLAFTSKTTLADVKAMDPISTMGVTEETFEAAKKELESKGAKFE
ncbi:LppU/SCO3897 family protein [Embleya sp. AB8]|uniref:LppU/SCO3897 family protein n=1 Tax=Embleya sp. AB8 TaxID=3156304 RepID=UPI003C7752BC